MFWKRDKKNTPISIVDRLTFFYAAVTISMLVILTLVAYAVVQEVIYAAEQQFIVDEVHIIRNLLIESPHDYSRLNAEVDAVPESLKNAEYRYYVRIYDQNNKTIKQTHHFNKWLIQPHFPPLSIDDWEHHALHWESSSGRHFISMTAPLLVDKDGKPILFMQMALDGTYPEELINGYWVKIVLFLTVLGILIALLGRWVSQKGLKPLYEMISLTQSITPERLTERIKTKNWPQELEPLAHSLNGMLARIETALNRISESTTELAHELRTPLNNLLLATEVTLSRDRNAAEYKQALESNLEEYGHLLDLAEKILFLSRLQNQQIALKKVEINIEEEIKHLCEFYSVVASEKNVLLECDVKGTLFAEKTLLRTVLSNLMSNALQYTPSGGKVSVWGRSEGDKFVLRIIDTGIGIPAENLRFIFERFYRGKKATKDHKGVGLGLAIVKTILDLHGAKIRVSSEVSKGTTMEIQMPL